MAHDNKIITEEEISKNYVMFRNGETTCKKVDEVYTVVRNVETTCKTVDMERGFELYQALYTFDCFGISAREDFIFASKSDEEAIQVSLEKEKQEQETDETYVCDFVSRLTIRENGSPMNLTIWRNKNSEDYQLEYDRWRGR